MAFERKGKPGGKSFKPKKEFREELLAIDRVTRVNSGWRQLRFRAVMVIGDGKGRVGLWMGKSWEVVDAIAKSIADAKKNLVNVTMVNGTVPYDIKVKNKSAIVMVHPASKGTWLIAGWAVRKVLSVAGYSDVLAKRYGSTNLINNARATIEALTSFKKSGSDFTKVKQQAKTEEKVEKKEEVKK